MNKNEKLKILMDVAYEMLISDTIESREEFEKNTDFIHKLIRYSHRKMDADNSLLELLAHGE